MSAGRRRPVLILGLAVITLVAGYLAWRRTRPAAVSATAPAGDRPRWYEPEVGPPPGLREALVRRGLVPPDAIDDGDGRFVSPADLTPAQRRALARRVARRAHHKEQRPQ